jgi:hypothetical protein
MVKFAIFQGKKSLSQTSWALTYGQPGKKQNSSAIKIWFGFIRSG